VAAAVTFSFLPVDLISFFSVVEVLAALFVFFSLFALPAAATGDAACVLLSPFVCLADAVSANRRIWFSAFSTYSEMI
jgi:hypothetical protein